MASLLYPDEEQAQIQAPLSLLQPPDDRPPVLQPDPRADALGTVYQQVMDAMEAQRRISAERGLWDDNTGLPTKAGLLDAIGQAGTAVALGTGGGAPESPGFTGYHASPHLFPPTPRNPLGEFDPSKIGTGEGNQAYGVGAGYLADAEALAQYYRKKLAGPRADYAGEIDPAFRAALKSEDYLGFDTAGQAISAMRSHPDWAKRWDVENPDALASGLAAHDTAMYGGQGHMYEVRVNADPAHFLDWDKPLSEQHPNVQAAFKRLGYEGGTDAAGNPMSGGDIYQSFGNPHGTARLLSEAGIPGIRYLDADSRQLPYQIAQSKQAIVEKQNQIAELQADIDRNQNNSNMLPAFFNRRRAEIADHQKMIQQINEKMYQGSRNSVVFSPEIMEIIRRYGIAGLMAGGGAAAMGGQQRQQQ